jgi:hypothetical protein
MDQDPDNLSGIWQGLYAYPEALSPVSFTATLLESGSWLSGSTHEAAEDDVGEWVDCYATLLGKRRGRSVRFTKTYDGRNGWSHSVDYDGEVSGDGAEISGRWRIEDVWSGKFLMIRSRTASVGALREAFERA